MEKAAAERDETRFLRLDRTLNLLVLEAARNEFASATMALMHGLSRRFWFMHWRQAAGLEGMTLMFQQEVAERICAAPDTDPYGRLAVLAQWRCRCSLLLRLPPGAFSPPPKVWSAVVGFVPHPEDPGEALFRAMERLTAAAFGQQGADCNHDRQMHGHQQKQRHRPFGTETFKDQRNSH
jgi:16S rRNA A1518/A1519 N6-dimethyltransferase RsmA/KsgA/DIM1 with predicted DNA glycosylase/AP lyase activity